MQYLEIKRKVHKFSNTQIIASMCIRFSIHSLHQIEMIRMCPFSPTKCLLDRIPNFILEQNRPQKWTRHPSIPLVCRIGSLFCSKITLGQFGLNWARFGPVLGPNRNHKILKINFQVFSHILGLAVCIWGLWAI